MAKVAKYKAWKNMREKLKISAEGILN